MKEFFYKVWDIIVMSFYAFLLLIIFTFNIPWNIGKLLIQLTKEYYNGEINDFGEYIVDCLLTIGNVLISPITKPYNYICECIELMKKD